VGTKSKKVPLHQLLVDRGFCTDEREARGWVLAGKAIVDEQRIDKAGQMVPVESKVRLKGRRRYVGKAGYKLEGALSDLRVDVTGRIVLDAGAAAGGFTDCLLQHGAAKIHAVDVGYGSLAGKLRSDWRVVNLEKTNISDLRPEHLIPRPELATVDLSYLSLTKAIPIIAELLEPDGEMICLVKPLFEIPDSQARRTGIILEDSSYAEILGHLLGSVEGMGIQSIGLTHSHVTGSKGTLEFFIHLAKHHAGPPVAFDVRNVVNSALALNKQVRLPRDKQAQYQESSIQ